MMEHLVTILTVAAGAGVLAPTLAVVLAVYLARFHFGRYVRREYPGVWERLVTHGDRSAILSLRIHFDATPEMGEFRAAVGDDLGDPELAKRRRRANRAERYCIGAFIGGGIWIAVAALLIALLRAD